MRGQQMRQLNAGCGRFDVSVRTPSHSRSTGTRRFSWAWPKRQGASPPLGQHLGRSGRQTPVDGWIDGVNAPWGMVDDEVPLRQHEHRLTTMLLWRGVTLPDPNQIQIGYSARQTSTSISVNTVDTMHWPHYRPCPSVCGLSVSRHLFRTLKARTERRNWTDLV